MAIIPRDAARQQAAALGLVAANTLAREVQRIAPDVVRAAREAAVRHTRPRRAPKPKDRSARAGAPKDGVSGATNVVAPWRPLGKSEKSAFTYNGSAVVTITNGLTAGQMSAFYNLALDSQDNVWTLSTFSTRLGQLRSMYRHFRLLKLKVTWVPTQPNTAGGCVALAFDADTNVPAVTDPGLVYQREVATLAHICTATEINWRAFSAKDREERYCTVLNRTNATRPNEELSYGTLLVAGTNTLAANTAVGMLKLDFSIAFDEEC